MEKVRKNKRNNLKGINGITLVALVITIIILLILAGISIATLTGSGLFENARLAEQESKEKQELEDSTLKDYENKIGEYVKTEEYIESNRDTVEPNSQNTISATEHFIGEYYYNGKPIYEKTFYIAKLPNNTSKKYSHNISNVDTIWYNSSKSYINWSGGTTPWIYATSINTDTIKLNEVGISTFEIVTYKDRSSLSAYITLNYTKTTDAGNGNTIPATPAN